MGVGKTTVGRQLAKQLCLDFTDSDHEIERRTGVDIPLIFEIEGEAGFRTRESAIISELTERQGIVLATGGGAILDPENRSLLSARGFVVYLSAPIEQLLKRTAHDSNRPLLENKDPRQQLEKIMSEREPLYQSTSDLVVHSAQGSPNKVVKQIIEKMNETRNPLHTQGD